MSAAEVLADLGHLGVQLQVVGDRLRYWPQAAVPPELLDQIKLHKPDLVKLLNEARWAEHTHPGFDRTVLYDTAHHDGTLVWDDDTDPFWWDCFTKKREPRSVP